MLGEGNWAILGLAGRSQNKQEQEEPHSNQGVEEKLDVCLQPAEKCLRTYVSQFFCDLGTGLALKDLNSALCDLGQVTSPP